MYLLGQYVLFSLGTIWALSQLNPPPTGVPAPPPEDEDYTIQGSGAPI